MTRQRIAAYPWSEWCGEPFPVVWAEQGDDYVCTPDSFDSALRVHARRNDLTVTVKRCLTAGDRIAFFFRFDHNERV